MDDQTHKTDKKPRIPGWLTMTVWIIILIIIVAATASFKTSTRKNNIPKPVQTAPRPVEYEYKTN